MTKVTMKTLDASVRGSELWHMHLWHIGEGSLKVLSGRNMLSEYVADELDVCE